MERPAWRIGDTWSYDSVEHPTAESPATVRTSETYAVRTVAPSQYILDYSRKSADGTVMTSRQRWSPSLNLVGRVQSTGELRELVHYQWPLSVGASWDLAQSSTDLGSSLAQVKVRGWETVTVPAGVFRAIRVDLTWSGVIFQYTASRQASLWYAPDVKRHVRSEEHAYAREFLVRHVVSELTSFRLRGE